MMEFLTGPLLYLSIAVFIVGLIARVILYIYGINQKIERIAYKAHFGLGLVGALKSIFTWMIPGGTRGWRSQPVMTLVFFLFHVGAILLPFFLLGHTVVLQYLFGISFPSLPNSVADTLTICSLVGLIGLAARRVVVPEARALTKCEDWAILLIVALPFVTGACARFLSFGYEGFMLAHIITGEIFLIVAPFTKLSHMVLFFMSRAQIGMDFAIKRGDANRGSAFPW